MDKTTELICVLDDFYKNFNEFLERALISDQKSRLKKPALSFSVAMTMVIYFINLDWDYFNIFAAK